MYTFSCNHNNYFRSHSYLQFLSIMIFNTLSPIKYDNVCVSFTHPCSKMILIFWYLGYLCDCNVGYYVTVLIYIATYIHL